VRQAVMHRYLGTQENQWDAQRFIKTSMTQKTSSSGSSRKRWSLATSPTGRALISSAHRGHEHPVPAAKARAAHLALEDAQRPALMPSAEDVALLPGWARRRQRVSVAAGWRQPARHGRLGARISAGSAGGWPSGRRRRY
jgi:hypothetical protein